MGNRGGSKIFLGRRCTLRNDETDRWRKQILKANNKEWGLRLSSLRRYSFFFNTTLLIYVLQNICHIRKRQVISVGGPHPFHPSTHTTPYYSPNPYYFHDGSTESNTIEKTLALEFTWCFAQTTLGTLELFNDFMSSSRQLEPIICEQFLRACR